ncbi:MAG: hypothetical protein ACXVHO_09010 [Methanobacterium sp.]
MKILKDNDREQLRQLVKACLLEISKLKIELKKCQSEYKTSIKQERGLLDKKNQEIQEIQVLIHKMETENNKLKDVIGDMEAQLEESKNVKLYFKALTAKPKKDISSFQSQIYQLISVHKNTAEEHYKQIISIGFTELSLDNFNSILRNLERKGYFRSSKEDGKIFWQKIEK